MIGAGLAVASNGAMAIVRSVGEGPGRQGRTLNDRTSGAGGQETAVARRSSLR